MRQINDHAAVNLIAGRLPGRAYGRRVIAESDSFAIIPGLGPLAPGHSFLRRLTGRAEPDAAAADRAWRGYVGQRDTHLICARAPSVAGPGP